MELFFFFTKQIIFTIKIGIQIKFYFETVVRNNNYYNNHYGATNKRL